MFALLANGGRHGVDPYGVRGAFLLMIALLCGEDILGINRELDVPVLFGRIRREGSVL